MEQVSLLRWYQRETARLRLDINNLAAIRDELPDTCWNRIRLEP